jgi:hypothetical protein
VQTHVTAARVFSSNSVGIGPNLEHPPFPWIAINELTSTPFDEVRETGNSTSHAFAVYVYDELGDGTRINQILDGIRDQIKTLSGVISASGVRCTDALWQGTSALIPDREYSANVKFCTIRLVANK